MSKIFLADIESDYPDDGLSAVDTADGRIAIWILSGGWGEAAGAKTVLNRLQAYALRDWLDEELGKMALP